MAALPQVPGDSSSPTAIDKFLKPAMKQVMSAKVAARSIRKLAQLGELRVRRRRCRSTDRHQADPT